MGGMHIGPYDSIFTGSGRNRHGLPSGPFPGVHYDPTNPAGLEVPPLLCRIPFYTLYKCCQSLFQAQGIDQLRHRLPVVLGEICNLANFCLVQNGMPMVTGAEPVSLTRKRLLPTEW